MYRRIDGCIFCGRYNHRDDDCYYKSMQIQQITRGSNGKLTKVYPERRTNRNNTTPQRNIRSRSKTPEIRNRSQRSKTPEIRNISQKSEKPNQSRKITFAKNVQRYENHKQPVLNSNTKCKEWLQIGRASCRERV